jgi:LDH2 family malate/lactate/ureidoglycolate dehydrogenase
MIYNASDLTDFASAVFRKAGLDESEARLAADSLITADLRGVSSHGITRLRTYAKRVKTGVVAANAKAVIVNNSDTALLVDGCNGMGSSIGIQVMDMCMERARKHGCCFAAVNHANHFGIAAFYTMYAARNGMIGIAMSNAPASMVPIGGKKPMLGTNPLSVAIPAGKYPPLILDMASSVVAQGKIILAAKEGKDIPADWAVDEDGMPTTNPEKALKGAMLPFGGAKGYAIAFIIDILCSALSGAANSTRIKSYWDNFVEPQGLGFFMGAFDVGQFLPLDVFLERVDSMFGEMKECPPAPGNKEVFIPGEIEHLKTIDNMKNGISLGPAVVDDLMKLAAEYGVEPLKAIQ